MRGDETRDPNVVAVFRVIEEVEAPHQHFKPGQGQGRPKELAVQGYPLPLHQRRTVNGCGQEQFQGATPPVSEELSRRLQGQPELELYLPFAE